MTYYKAVRPDGTDFRTGRVQWAPKTGKVDRVRIVKHPTASAVGDYASEYLSVSTSPTACTGMKWPCRLLTVEPATGYEVTTPEPDGLPHKRAAVAWRVTGELDPLLALGPQGEQVDALIERASRLTADEARLLAAAWVAGLGAARGAAKNAAWGTAWNAARDAAWGAAKNAAWSAVRYAAWGEARGAARDAAWDAVRYAAWALVVRDLIDAEHYDVLTLPWRQTIGRIHPDDPEVRP